MNSLTKLYQAITGVMAGFSQADAPNQQQQPSCSNDEDEPSVPSAPNNQGVGSYAELFPTRTEETQFFGARGASFKALILNMSPAGMELSLQTHAGQFETGQKFMLKATMPDPVGVIAEPVTLASIDESSEVGDQIVNVNFTEPLDMLKAA